MNTAAQAFEPTNHYLLPTMQAVIWPTKLSKGDVINEGGLEFEVQAVESIKSPATNRTKHIHWCYILGAQDTKALTLCPKFQAKWRS